MIELFARPYRTDKEGFSFKTAKDYSQKMAQLCQGAGEPMEVAIQWLQGEDIDRELFDVLKIDQGNVQEYLDRLVEEDCFEAKIKMIICVKELGFTFAECIGGDTWSLKVFAFDTLEELAV